MRKVKNGKEQLRKSKRKVKENDDKSRYGKIDTDV